VPEGIVESQPVASLTLAGRETNLLGLVKHLSSVELLYLGFAFGRNIEDPPAWFGTDVAPNTDKWATSVESSDLIVGTYKRAWLHSDATISSVDLDSAGFVPWLPDGQMSLHGVLVHVLAGTERHAGHADIVRELIDGAVSKNAGRRTDGPRRRGRRGHAGHGVVADVSVRNRTRGDGSRSPVTDSPGFPQSLDYTFSAQLEKDGAFPT
jgi:hypothetical protein